MSTSTKSVATIFMLIMTAISFWIYNAYVAEEGRALIFQLHSRHGNASFEEIFSQEVERKYRPRILLNAEASPTWIVKSFYSFFYIELNVAGKPYNMVLDSESTLSWVNCKFGDYGPSVNYLVK